MKLSDCIKNNMERLLEGWEEFANSFPPGRKMNSAELRDHAKQMLEWIADNLGCPQTEEERAEKSKGRSTQGTTGGVAATHGAVRLEAGFDINEVVAEYRALRAGVMQLWISTKTTIEQTDFDDLLYYKHQPDFDEILTKIEQHVKAL